MSEENDVRHGILQVPESYPGIDTREYWVLYNQSTDKFVVVQRPGVDSQTTDYIEAQQKMFGHELEYIRTVHCKSIAEADLRCAEIELWHRDGWEGRGISGKHN
jgi:hypothetical protein